MLSIQPLVENAIKHGVAASTGPGYVRIEGRFSGDELRILIENSGCGGSAETMGTGVGLQNVRRRLEICYGPEAELRLIPTDEKTTVELSIPRSSIDAAV